MQINRYSIFSIPYLKTPYNKDALCPLCMCVCADLRLLQGCHAAAEDSCAVLTDLQEQALVAAGVCIRRCVHY